jgi:predicted nucleotidyltransferase
VVPLVDSKRDALHAVCQRFGVARLELFGSAATGSRDEDAGDLDFLVEFLPEQSLGPWLAHYFDFQAALERLFGRRVDLVMTGALRDPSFIREVNRSRKVLYAA